MRGISEYKRCGRVDLDPGFASFRMQICCEKLASLFQRFGFTSGYVHEVRAVAMATAQSLARHRSKPRKKKRSREVCASRNFLRDAQTLNELCIWYELDQKSSSG
jgi:hypothetical protein